MPRHMSALPWRRVEKLRSTPLAFITRVTRNKAARLHEGECVVEMELGGSESTHQKFEG
jgi:hypothetical protein